MGNVLHLPGIVPEGQVGAKTLDEDWPQIEKTLEIALGKLQSMRSTEGGVMAQELMALRNKIFEHLASIKVLIPHNISISFVLIYQHLSTSLNYSLS